MSALEPVADDIAALRGSNRAVIAQARFEVARSVGVAIVQAYWHIGGLIDAHFQVAPRAATYGVRLLKNLSVQLRADLCPGFELTNLKHMRQFYESFNIGHAARDQCSDDSRLEISPQLSWTHYRLLTKVHRPEARRHYMTEAIAGRWSTRELDRQIITRHFERGLTSAPTKALGAELQITSDPSSAESWLRDPYVLEFLGLPDRLISSERELEQALIAQLQAFLLELVREFSFVGRQHRITIDANHFHVDLVFYNYVLKCFVLIDLKTGQLDHGDTGQMDFYVHYWEAEVRGTDDNPTIGLIPCAEKGEAMARYTLLSDHQSIFAAKYLPYLPTEDELQRELQRERHLFEMRHLDTGARA